MPKKFCLVLLLAVVLRLSLAWVNAESNDDHFEVIKLLRAHGNHLSFQDCHECFQPKLFHRTGALLVDFLPSMSERGQIRAVTLLNALVGSLTVLLLLWWIAREAASRAFALPIAALIALNPELVGIHGQLTNDTFAIFFGTVTLIALHDFLLRKRPASLIFLVGAATLAMATKGTTWVTLAVTAALLVACALSRRARGAKWWPVPGALLALAVLLPLAGTTADYDWQDHVTNLSVAEYPPLHFSQPTYVRRPGIVSIRESYLTFRLLELMEYPVLRYPKMVPKHRTSFWTILYGRLSSSVYPGFPPSHATFARFPLSVARLSYWLGLVPVMLLLWGAASATIGALTSARKGKICSVEALCALLCGGSLGSLIYFTARMRDFTTIKATYIMPALLGWVAVFLLGADRFERVATARARRCVFAALWALVGVYIVDAFALIERLS